MHQSFDVYMASSNHQNRLDHALLPCPMIDSFFTVHCQLSNMHAHLGAVILGQKEARNYVCLVIYA